MGAGWSQLSTLLAKGGSVMPPLVACAIVLLYALGYRWVMLRSTRLDARTALATARLGRTTERGSVLARAAAEGWNLVKARPPHLRSQVTEALAERESELGRFSTIAMGVVGVAPLLGLLGTVSGMIETFDSLGSNTLMSATGGGVAGGISEALFSTQLGLMVAIPGLLLGKLLERRQTELELELTKLGDLLVAAGGEQSA